MREDGRMIDEAIRGIPAPALRPLVAWYSGYRQEGLAPARHRGLPSPYLTMILTLDDPLVVDRHPDPAQAPGSYRTLLGGLHTVPVLLSHDGRQSGIQVALHPLGVRRLLGLPAGALGGLDVHGTEILGSTAVELHERLRLSPSWASRFQLLDDTLLRLCSDVAEPAAPDGEVTEAWRLLLRGEHTVAEVAETVGWSPRRLSARFGAELGVPPKAAAKIARFDRARHRLQAATGVLRLADLAAECGYYDQAHLARDFRELAGLPPSEWLAAEGRFVQAQPDEPGEW
jgi:AraC-like DNA-binding protein